MEIKHRHITKYSEDLRRELMGTPTSSSPSSTTNTTKGKPEDIDELLKYHHTMQEKIAEHMIELTRSIKEQAMTAGNIIKSDTEVWLCLLHKYAYDQCLVILLIT